MWLLFRKVGQIIILENQKIFFIINCTYHRAFNSRSTSEDKRLWGKLAKIACCCKQCKSHNSFYHRRSAHKFLSSEMSRLLHKFGLDNTPPPFTIHILQPLIDGLNVQLKVISHKLSRVIACFPETYQPGRIVVHGIDIASTNREGVGHIDLLYRVNQFFKTDKYLCLFCNKFYNKRMQ